MMAFARVRNLAIKYRSSLTDLVILIVVLFVGLYLTYKYDIFKNSDGVRVHEETIELDEALLLGGIMALGFLVFSARRYFELAREMTLRVAAERQVSKLAFQDPLTGLANRRKFDETLKDAIAAPPRVGAAHAVILLDLNGFKQINDVYGHGEGDRVLVIVAQRLIGTLRCGDLLARLGGDEFAILARHLAGPEAATIVGLRVIEALSKTVTTGSLRHQITAGLGISLVPEDATTPEEALRRADLALYSAKADRSSTLRFFEECMDTEVQERQSLRQELSLAVGQGSIRAYFQPSVQLDTKKIVGFEAFPRWLHPTFGEMMPGQFIPIAEETGLIHVLTDQMLRQGCTVAARWPKHVVLSVHVLSSQLQDKNLKTRITDILRETGLPPERLEIEIDESSFVQHREAAQRILGSLREAGVQIAFDNFGASYSSLYYLRGLKLNKIKFDGSFIRSMIFEQEGAGIIRALVDLAHSLGITIASNGIEDSAQHAALIRNGCEQGQGHLYSDPVSAGRTLSMIEGNLRPHQVT
jgi:diguanylate cyclase (GGDEF)-like protein